MSSKTRAFLLSLTIIAVLVFSAFGPTIAYADGGTTTDTPPTETTTTTTDEASVEATSTADPATAEATSAPEETTAPATDAPTEVTAEATATPEEVTTVATDVPTEATAEPTTDTTAEATAAPESTDAATTTDAPATEETAPAADSTVLDAVPENTTVTVLDANGESQPLATADAAAAIATSDPVWCPSTQSAPTPGANGCTDSYPSFDLLLQFLSANPTYQGTGTIYVEQGAYAGGESTIDFNAYSLPNISSADLTVTGGWNPVDGTTSSSTPSTFNNVSIIIGSATNPWGGSLTLSNITMNFTPQSSAPAVPVNGLTLNTQANITLNNVNVTNAPTDGADLDAGGNVNVVKSKLDRNQVAGAKIKSGGSVAIVDSSFSNPANGRRQDTGLDIQSAGSVTLFDVVTNENRQVGTNIVAGGPVTVGGTTALPDGTCPTGSCGSFFSGTKILQGGAFWGYGLQVVTSGAIIMDRVTASDNFLWGASLTTTTPGANIAITNSIFNANTTASPGFMDDTGLVINGAGNVALDNVTASNNRKYGAQIEADGTVTINGSEFSNNRGTITTGGVATDYGHGLWISSPAGIFLSNVTANNNMLFGAQLISTTGNVDISFSNFNNNGVGADIQATNVSLTNVTASDNDKDGIVVNGACVEILGGTYSGNGQYGVNLGSTSLDLVTMPTFGSNAAGNIFPTTPVICDLLGAGGSTTTTTTSMGASNIFTSLSLGSSNLSSQTAASAKSGTVFSTSTGSDNVTLSGFLSNSKISGGGTLASIFFGKYAYLYSSAGMQIVAYVPSSTEVAKG